MFNFDVHDDVRLTHDAAVEKDEVRTESGRRPKPRASADLTAHTVPRWKGYRAELVQPQQA